MATKDLNASEDIKRGPQTQSDPEEKKETVAATIKNAHATGDGSFGRNDESVPDKEQKPKKDDSSY